MKRPTIKLTRPMPLWRRNTPISHIAEDRRESRACRMWARHADALQVHNGRVVG